MFSSILVAAIGPVFLFSLSLFLSFSPTFKLPPPYLGSTFIGVAGRILLVLYLFCVFFSPTLCLFPYNNTSKISFLISVVLEFTCVFFFFFFQFFFQYIHLRLRIYTVGAT